MVCWRTALLLCAILTGSSEAAVVCWSTARRLGWILTGSNERQRSPMINAAQTTRRAKHFDGS